MHYLYRTIGKKESSVSRRLVELGCDVFCPMFDGSPLFPGYLFVNEENANPYELGRVPGSLGIVSFGDQQAKVSDALVESFRSTEWQRSEECATGSTVRIKDGPFNHMQAIVKAKKGDRIIVLMNILNSEQELSLALRDVEAA